MKKSTCILLSSMCIIALVGCNSKKNEAFTATPSSQPVVQSQNAVSNSPENIKVKDSSETGSMETTKVAKPQESKNLQDKKASTAETSTKTNTSKTKKVGSAPNNDTDSFEKYFRLIGMSKEKLISSLDEQPVSVDEGGMEFKKTGIRVWFSKYGSSMIVEQIYIEKSDVNYNGVKIGDNISSFKKMFGKPDKEDAGPAYCNFKYNGMFLNVNYDPKTQKTFSVYIMKNEFK